MSLHTWRRPGPRKPSSCATFMLKVSLGQSCHRQKKVLLLGPQGRFNSVRLFVALWPVVCQAFLSGRGVLQAGILERIGQYWLPYPLEHRISCCPSRQLPWLPHAARNPATQAAAPPPPLALTGANPSPPGKLQEQTPVDDPHVEVQIKPELKPRGSVAKEEDPKPSHQLYKLQIKPTRSTRQTLCL